MGILDRITGRTAPLAIANERGEIELHAQPAPYSKDRALVAAARKVEIKTSADLLDHLDRPFEAWQREAWTYFNSIGEVNFGLTVLGSVMSRVRLYPAVIVDPDAPPTATIDLRRRANELNEKETSEETADKLTAPEDLTEEVMDYMDFLLERLGSGPSGLAGLLRTFTLNQSVAGECYLVKYQDEWSIRSSQEVKIRPTDGKWILQETRSGRGQTVYEKVLDPNFIFRIWRQHPQFSGEPHSTMMALLEPCDELLTLQRMIRGVARSRMNAGIMFIPDDITVASRSVAETEEEAEEDNEVLMNEIFDAVTTPITNESAASTVTPVFLTGPADSGEKIKWISIARDSDQFLVERADKALDRILNGLDAPKDMITGFASVKYNNAMKVDDNMYNSHVEPLAVMLCDAITLVYLRTFLKAKFGDALSAETLSKLVYWYDPTEIVIKPNPAEAATKGHELNVVNDAAWRRANGFADTDAPSERELAMRIIMGMKNIPPEVQAIMLERTFPELFGNVIDELAKAKAIINDAQPTSGPPMEEETEGEESLPPKEENNNG